MGKRFELPALTLSDMNFSIGIKHMYCKNENSLFKNYKTGIKVASR